MSKKRSLLFAVVLFWIFLTLPRIWYYVEEGVIFDGVFENLHTILVGFLRDGAVACALLLPLQYFSNRLARLPHRAYHVLHGCLTAFFILVIVFAMANVEFFRYFGSNANITHLAFISDSEILLPSFSETFPPLKLFLIFILIPGLFLGLAYGIPAWKVDLFLKSRVAIAAYIFFLVMGVSANALIGQKDPLRQNLTDNYLYSMVKYSILGDDIEGKSSEPIEKILDPMPLSNPAVKNPEWHFFDPKYPLAKATDHQLCVMGKWDKALCAKDGDGDGYPLQTDCNDLEPGIRPGAMDIPGNGIDEDCSGADENLPNIIYIHWEGARAVNVGSIGYSTPVTPRFDALSKKGLLFRNAYANGTQTRWSITSIYNSILPRLSTKWIFKHNPELNLLSIPVLLRDHGYETIYIHGGDIDFGNFKKRFWEWFEVMFDRNTEPIKSMRKVGWGATDKDIFDYSYKYLSERTDKRPFYLTIATLSLHHPFYMPDTKYEVVTNKPWTARKVPNVLHYSDAMMGDFLDKILADKRFANTLVIVSADHGLNMAEPHNTTAQSTLWEDLVWVPVLLLGNWNVAPGVNDEVRQLADIGPTILDRLGISVPNHFIGHSLLRKFEPGRDPKAFFGNANGGISAGMRMGKYKYFISFRNNNERLYDMEADRQEKHNLADDPANFPLLKTFYDMVTGVYAQNTKLIKENRIWNWDFSAASK